MGKTDDENKVTKVVKTRRKLSDALVLIEKLTDRLAEAESRLVVLDQNHEALIQVSGAYKERLIVAERSISILDEHSRDHIDLISRHTDRINEVKRDVVKLEEALSMKIDAITATPIKSEDMNLQLKRINTQLEATTLATRHHAKDLIGFNDRINQLIHDNLEENKKSSHRQDAQYTASVQMIARNDERLATLEKDSEVHTARIGGILHQIKNFQYQLLQHTNRTNYVEREADAQIEELSDRIDGIITQERQNGIIRHLKSDEVGSSDLTPDKRQDLLTTVSKTRNLLNEISSKLDNQKQKQEMNGDQITDIMVILQEMRKELDGTARINVSARPSASDIKKDDTPSGNFPFSDLKEESKIPTSSNASFFGTDVCVGPSIQITEADIVSALTDLYKLTESSNVQSSRSECPKIDRLEQRDSAIHRFMRRYKRVFLHRDFRGVYSCEERINSLVTSSLSKDAVGPLISGEQLQQIHEFTDVYVNTFMDNINRDSNTHVTSGHSTWCDYFVIPYMYRELAKLIDASGIGSFQDAYDELKTSLEAAGNSMSLMPRFYDAGIVSPELDFDTMSWYIQNRITKRLQSMTERIPHAIKKGLVKTKIYVIEDVPVVHMSICVGDVWGVELDKYQPLFPKSLRLDTPKLGNLANGIQELICNDAVPTIKSFTAVPTMCFVGGYDDVHNTMMPFMAQPQIDTFVKLCTKLLMSDIVSGKTAPLDSNKHTHGEYFIIPREHPTFAEILSSTSNTITESVFTELGKLVNTSGQPIDVVLSAVPVDKTYNFPYLFAQHVYNTICRWLMDELRTCPDVKRNNINLHVSVHYIEQIPVVRLRIHIGDESSTPQVKPPFTVKFIDMGNPSSDVVQFLDKWRKEANGLY